MTVPDGLALVPARPLVEDAVELRIALRPGDRATVVAGEPVAAGMVVAERLRDPRTELLAARAPVPDAARPGDRWAAPVARAGDADEAAAAGELLFLGRGRWRLARGDHAEVIEVPAAGVASVVRPGTQLRITTAARAVLGREVLGGPAIGRLEVIAGRDADVRAADLDVDLAGAIVVAGARIDAEAITRARAVGIRGIVVGSLGTRERRDALAAEARGRVAVHGLPPFAILVLEGALRLPIPSAMMAVLQALEGRTVGLVADPPALVFDIPSQALPAPDPAIVRIRSGPSAGLEGRFGGLAGRRTVGAGVAVEMAWVEVAGRRPLAIGLGELDRFTAR
jgi:hypothetical protein